MTRKARSRCVPPSDWRYEPNPKSRPPAKAAGHQRVQLRNTKNIDSAEPARARWVSRLKLAMGPSHSVTGMATMPRGSASVLPARFTPAG